MKPKTKATTTVTKLKRIAELSRKNPAMVFNCVITHINVEFLKSCFKRLDWNKAPGIDRQTKEDYVENLDARLEDLVGQMKAMAYKPGPVREVSIPKDNGGERKLGISNFEDKIVQMAFSLILEAIYEPIFYQHSYGFRRGRNCHQALKACREHLYRGKTRAVLDVDLENFFGTIDHKKLILLLRMKIKDERFIRYIGRMLRAGVLSNGELRVTDEGTPQGSVVSPILSNIFAHYAIDQWIRHEVKPRHNGEVEAYRYCDDMIIVCLTEREAQEIKLAMEKRLERFSLRMNKEKTKVVFFTKNWRAWKRKRETFNFLGFTFYWGKSLKGYEVLKLRTSRKKVQGKLKRVSRWCKEYRSKHKLSKLWEVFCSKLRGHIQYFGVSYNCQQVRKFLHQAIRIFHKWLNRRGGKGMEWESFQRFMEKSPPPRARIVHKMF